MNLYSNTNAPMDGDYITIPTTEYKSLLTEAMDGARLKAFIRESVMHYNTLDHKSLSMICDLYGIKTEDEE